MILHQLTDFRFVKNEWEIIDFRIDIPPSGRGSDAINPHTQYSNPIAKLSSNGTYYGAGFTLGLGNNIVCQTIEEILSLWDGKTLREISNSLSVSPYEVMQNPLQLRWLSPNSGVVYQAVGIIANTLLEKFSVESNVPLWKSLSEIKADEFTDFYGRLNNLFGVKGAVYLNRKERNHSEINAYHTTWIGSKAEELVEEIMGIHKEKGITLFKLKIGSDINYFINRLDTLIELLPEYISLAVDANQTLTLDCAIEYMQKLSDRNIVWLEEPFAPDNVLLFEKLCALKKQNDWSTEIVTGENCPSPHIAEALIKSGIDRFQADPCRMMGMIDIPLVISLCIENNCKLTPHAGGSLLDEMSAHISTLYSEIEGKENSYLIENVGFCAQFLQHATKIKNGILTKPQHVGFLGGFENSLEQKFKSYKEGVTWVTL